MHPHFQFAIANIFSFSIPAYSLFSCVGLFFFMTFLYVRTCRINLLFKKYLLLVIYLMVGVGIGSKVLFFITQIPSFLHDFSLKTFIITFIRSGFVFYGGLFGAIAALKIFSYVEHISFRQMSNLAAPTFPLFHMWGRMGCFFAGCCYGKPAAWGVEMWQDPGVLRIPIQLIECSCLSVLFFVLVILEKRYPKNFPLMEIYLICYAVCRFILEFFRGDTIRGIWFGLSTSQWISIFIVVLLGCNAVRKSIKIG